MTNFMNGNDEINKTEHNIKKLMAMTELEAEQKSLQIYSKNIQIYLHMMIMTQVTQKL